MDNVKKLEDEIAAWPGISVHTHRFGGREFRFETAELGHVHAGGVVDIPFSPSIHDALLAMVPPELTDKPYTGKYRVREGHLPRFGFKISRADVADFLIRSVENQFASRKVFGFSC